MAKNKQISVELVNNQQIIVDPQQSVVVFRDGFLSGWGCAENKKHYQIILSNSPCGDCYKLKQYAISNDKTIKNIRLMKLSNAMKLESFTIRDCFPIAHIEKYQH